MHIILKYKISLKTPVHKIKHAYYLEIQQHTSNILKFLTPCIMVIYQFKNTNFDTLNLSVFN
jgi:hypothetical protein